MPAPLSRTGVASSWSFDERGVVGARVFEIVDPVEVVLVPRKIVDRNGHLCGRTFAPRRAGRPTWRPPLNVSDSSLPMEYRGDDSGQRCRPTKFRTRPGSAGLPLCRNSRASRSPQAQSSRGDTASVPCVPAHSLSKGLVTSTSSWRKSRMFLVATVNRWTLAVAAIIASSIRVSDFRCLTRAHSRKAAASIGRMP